MAALSGMLALISQRGEWSARHSRDLDHAQRPPGRAVAPEADSVDLCCDFPAPQL